MATPSGILSGSPPPPAPAPRCSCPSSTVCSWQCGAVAAKKPRSGCSDPNRKPETLRTDDATTSSALTGLTAPKPLLLIAPWGSDLPTRRHAEESRPTHTGGRAMPSTTSITIDKLARLVGTPKCPAVIDVRTDEDFAEDPRLIPGSLRRAHASVSQWAA